ncbi:MAG: hypothetical protein ACLP59_26770 [Bryobacteraceae bacterium]
MERADAAEAQRTGDPSKLFMFAVPAAELESAGAANRQDARAGAELRRQLQESPPCCVS